MRTCRGRSPLDRGVEESEKKPEVRFFQEPSLELAVEDDGHERGRGGRRPEDSSPPPRLASELDEECEKERQPNQALLGGDGDERRVRDSVRVRDVRGDEPAVRGLDLVLVAAEADAGERMIDEHPQARAYQVPPVVLEGEGVPGGAVGRGGRDVVRGSGDRGEKEVAGVDRALPSVRVDRRR